MIFATVFTLPINLTKHNIHSTNNSTNIRQNHTSRHVIHSRQMHKTRSLKDPIGTTIYATESVPGTLYLYGLVDETLWRI